LGTTTGLPREETQTLALLLVDGFPTKVASLYHPRGLGFVTKRPAARRHEELEVHTTHTSAHTQRHSHLQILVSSGVWYFFVSGAKKEIEVSLL